MAIQEIGSGDYWVYYTPTAAATLYVLDIAMVSATNQVSPASFQDDIQTEAATTSGPYLTTRSAFKTAWNITGTADDGRIDALLAEVTAQVEGYCDRVFAQASVTEYPRITGVPLRRVLLARPPISTPVTSLYLSTEIPRVYDSTTLLVEGTDYFVDEDAGIIEFAYAWTVCPPTTKVVKATYTGGYATIPTDLERAAQELIGVKLEKGKGKLYHVLSESRLDGSIAGIRFDDMTPNALSVFDGYRRMVLA